jgi:hypothetical protein
MKKLICGFTVIALLQTLQAIAQSPSQRIMGTFIFQNNSYNFEFTHEADNNYGFYISAVTDAVLKTPAAGKWDDGKSEGQDGTDSVRKEIKPDSSEQVQAAQRSLFSNFTVDIFKAIFIAQIKKLETSTDGLEDKAVQVFYMIQTRLDFIDDEPITAYLILKYDNIYSYLRSNESNYYKASLNDLITSHTIDRVDVETEGGAIKNVRVKVVRPGVNMKNEQSPRKFLEFKNLYPITISGKFDPEKFADINLYCFNCNGVKGLTRYIKLADLLVLDVKYENEKENYSPSDRVFSLLPSLPIVELRKEKRSKIIEIAAFTDFVGLDRSEPNGLIQIDAKRKILLNTKARLLSRMKDNELLLSKIDLHEVTPRQVPSSKKNYLQYELVPRPLAKKTSNDSLSKGVETIIKKYEDSIGVLKDSVISIIRMDSITKKKTLKKLEEERFILIRRRKFHSTYSTWFNYIEPRLLFSKLEDNNRFIDSGKVTGGEISPLLLYQYQLISFGAKLQIYKLNFPQLKFQWDLLTVGGYWGRSRLALTSDSVGPSEALNSSYVELQTSFNFRPDSRWGASIGFSYLMPRIWNPKFDVANKKGLMQWQFDGHLRTTLDSKLFFRYRWTYQHKDRDLNFTQMQLGYSLFIFAGSNVSTPQVPVQ